MPAAETLCPAAAFAAAFLPNNHNIGLKPKKYHRHLSVPNAFGAFSSNKSLLSTKATAKAFCIFYKMFDFS